MAPRRQGQVGLFSLLQPEIIKQKITYLICVKLVLKPRMSNMTIFIAWHIKWHRLEGPKAEMGKSLPRLRAVANTWCAFVQMKKKKRHPVIKRCFFWLNKAHNSVSRMPAGFQAPGWPTVLTSAQGTKRTTTYGGPRGAYLSLQRTSPHAFATSWAKSLLPTYFIPNLKTKKFIITEL